MPGTHEILTKRKSTILQKWYQRILDSYPAETARFLREEQDPFANPVGTTIYHGLEGLYEEILAGMDAGRVRSYLDSIIRIRAVQDFSPSQAVAFIFQLEHVLKEELAGEIQEKGLSLEELETRLEELALLAFDIYMQCREQLWEIKIEEIKNRTTRLLQRANLNINIP
ncbi:RsbRD N-terminal domain-containing protein [Moorella sp. ACPs]|uniref:RsbRD N-terminal domain-containing protein n=1 Tax=Neomoorella carbonis TaxID=3062783 RepID=UPI0038734330